MKPDKKRIINGIRDETEARQQLINCASVAISSPNMPVADIDDITEASLTFRAIGSWRVSWLWNIDSNVQVYAVSLRIEQDICHDCAEKIESMITGGVSKSDCGIEITSRYGTYTCVVCGEWIEDGIPF